MALTRKFLSALGIEADKVDEIISAHAETVDALKAERDEFKASAKKAEELEAELTETKKQLENNGKDDSYKVKYEALKEDFESFKNEQNQKELTASKDKAYRAMLKENGVSEKRIDAIMKVTDLSSIELDGDKLKDAENISKSVKEEWADFIVTEGKKGSETETPPGGDGGSAPKSIPLIF